MVARRHLRHLHGVFTSTFLLAASQAGIAWMATCRFAAEPSFDRLIISPRSCQRRPGFLWEPWSVTDTAVPGRVLHIVRRAGEPSQTFILDAILELQRRGWHTDVLSVLPPVGAGTALPLVPTARASFLRRARRRASGESESTYARHESAAAVKAAKPDVLHIHFGWTATQVDIEGLGVPALVSFHGSDVNAWPHRDPANLAAYGQLFASVRHVTAVSNTLAERLRHLGFTRSIDVIPAGVRLDHFVFRPPRRTARDPRLLFVGRLVSCKGVDVLIEAMPGLLEADRQVELDVIGDGELRRDAEQLASKLGVRRRIRFHGAQSHAQVAQAMRDADVLVVPSRRSADGEEEGSPVAPKEALATGVAVVATAVGGIPDIIAPEYRHELVAPDDPQALAAQILRVIDAPEEWGERARIGRAWVEKQFDSRQLIGRIETLYQALKQETHVIH
jgi:colanic acid/amylovoran biosynthesis glycosyltransferase